MMLKLNGMNLTKHIVMGSYQVNKNDEFDKWADCNGANHRNVKGQRISGQCSLHFRTQDDAEGFQLILKNKPNNFFTVCAHVNNMGVDETFGAYVTCAPSHKIRGGQKLLADFTLTIEGVDLC